MRRVPHDTRWRGRIPIPDRAHRLVQDLIRCANEEQATLTEVSERAGIERSTTHAWRYRSTPRVDLLDKALNAIGFELCVRRRAPDKLAKRRDDGAIPADLRANVASTRNRPFGLG